MRRLSSARSSSSAQTGQAGRRRHKDYPARQHQRTRRTPHQNRRLPGNCCDYADRASPNATSSTNTPRLSLRQAKRRSEAREDPARPNTGFTGRRAIRKRLRLPPSPPRILTSQSAAPAAPPPAPPSRAPRPLLDSSNLPYPKFHPTGSRAGRAQRHNPKSIVTLRILIARVLIGRLPCCPFCRTLRS